MEQRRNRSWLDVGAGGPGPGFRRSNDANSGQYSVEIYTWYTAQIGILISGSNPDNFGIPEHDLRYGGFRLTRNPLRLTGYYKLTNDTRPDYQHVYAMVLLKKFNTGSNKVDTIQFIKHKMLPADKYTFFEIPFSHTSSGAPDSILISFSSWGFCDENNPNSTESGNCLFLKIDDLKLDSEDTANKNIKAYPNPFTNGLNIEYNIETGTSVNISILNYLGQTVKTLVSSSFVSPGYYFLRWEQSHLPSGVYFCTLRTSVSTKIIKVLHIP